MHYKVYHNNKIPMADKNHRNLPSTNPIATIFTANLHGFAQPTPKNLIFHVSPYLISIAIMYLYGFYSIVCTHVVKHLIMHKK